MKGVHTFSPNAKTHLEFAETLRNVSNKGVNVIAVDCVSGMDFMTVDKYVNVKLD